MIKRGLIIAASVIACRQVLGLGEPVPSEVDGGIVSPFTPPVPPGTAQPPDPPPDTTSCKADVMTDAKHCGRCNHDCRGALCDRGACKPIPVATLTGSGIFTVANGFIYVIESKSLVRIGAAREQTILAEAPNQSIPLSIYVDREFVVWSSFGDGVVACPIQGCVDRKPIKVSDTNATGAVTGLLVDTKWKYIWLNIRSPERIVKEGRDGGVTLAPVPGVGESNCTNFATHEQLAFFTDVPRARILAVPAAGRPTNAFDVAAPCAITASNGQLFFTDPSNIWRADIAKDGKLASAMQLANDQAEPKTIAADATHVYWATWVSGDSSIRRCKRTGCDLKPETLVGKLPLPRTVAVDDTFVYYTVLNPGTGADLWKVAK